MNVEKESINMTRVAVHRRDDNENSATIVKNGRYGWHKKSPFLLQHDSDNTLPPVHVSGLRANPRLAGVDAGVIHDGRDILIAVPHLMNEEKDRKRRTSVFEAIVATATITARGAGSVPTPRREGVARGRSAVRLLPSGERRTTTECFRYNSWDRCASCTVVVGSGPWHIRKGLPVH